MENRLTPLFRKPACTLTMILLIYCFKGARAANTYIALKLAGFKHLRNYYGSWNEWSRNASLPVMSVKLMG